MNTSTTKEPIVETSVTVNFLKIGEKCFDWRYKTYDDLRNLNISKPQYEITEKTIYWLGTIDLLPVIAGKSKYPISFIPGSGIWEHQNDSERRRDVDGADIGHNIISYQFPTGIMNALLNARNKGHAYFHVLMEEKVDYQGNHEVCLLHRKTRPDTDGYKYGIPSDKPWTQSPTKDYIELSYARLTEDIERVCLRSNNEYRWTK